jgi:hypothetical protein
MAAALQSARLHYLRDAALFARPRASTVAALLKAEMARLTGYTKVNLPKAREAACRACGNLLPREPASEAREVTRNSRRRAMKSAKRTPTSAQGTFTHVSCTRCKKRTRVSSTKKMQIVEAEALLQRTVVKEVIIKEGEPSPRQDSVAARVNRAPKALPIFKPTLDQRNVASRQRAKSKKQSGLQALLAKNKAASSASSSGGLDLMDFMKSG